MKPLLVGLIVTALSSSAFAQTFINPGTATEGQATRLQLLSAFQESPVVEIPAGPNDVWTWSFGDGSPAATVIGQNYVWHVFPRGLFTVTVNINGTHTISGNVYSFANPPIYVDIDAPVQVFENAGSFTVVFSRSGDVSGTTTVNYDFGPEGALLGGAEAKSGTLVFAPGEMMKQVTIALFDDAGYSGSREPHLIVSVTDGATLRYGAQRTYRVDVPITLLDDEPPPTLTVDDAVAREGADCVFTVHLSAPFARRVNDLFYVADAISFQPSPDLTATPNKDYRFVNGFLDFPAGSTTAQFRVPTINDNVPEPNETFALRITNFADYLMPVVMARPRATCTIVNDDYRRRVAAPR